MAGRKAISKKLRFEIFKRDRFVCQYCGRSPPVVILEVDHVLAVSGGGDNSPENLVTSCFDCNRGKGSGDLRQVRPGLAEQSSLIRERREQLEAYNALLLEERGRLDRLVEELGYYYHNKFLDRDKFVFADRRAASIRRFLEFLPPAEIMDAIDLACAKSFPTKHSDERTFKYLCGVCWTKIKRQGLS